MNDKVLKYIFFASAGILLLVMVIASRDAGITCDEVLHYNHSVRVLDFFATHGRDQGALHTPVTHLKYYGQSYDNIVTILSEWLNIDDVYRFRHLMSSLAGWLAIVVTALTAVWLSGYRTGLLVVLLFSVSPAFLGHSQNNLKDIPFALGYISSIYYTFKFISPGRIAPRDILLLTASIAFTISIRAGGLLMICYLLLFCGVFWLTKYKGSTLPERKIIRARFLWIAIIAAASWLLGISLWPFALQAPVRNVLESYRVMAHFPDTFRQIFEGRVEWSDYMPWYYLLKSMAITIPLIVLAGFLLFFLRIGAMAGQGKIIFHLFLVFSIFFPVLFVLYEKSNLYSSWRQFLFLYPPIVILAASGFNLLWAKLSEFKYAVPSMLAGMALLSIHPLKFIVMNHRYAYIYYNQLVGGLQGAYGNYETDYYYVSQTEASQWLLNYLKEKNDTGRIIVKATYSVNWQFRRHPEIETSYFRYEERSMTDWDYAISVNRYIPPYQLKKGIWPPGNAIHIIYADKVPICAILARKTKDDWHGYEALCRGKDDEAIKYFEGALKTDSCDEMIFYNFATALYSQGYKEKADSALERSLALNPGFEPALMYLGNIAVAEGKGGEAVGYYKKVIASDRKYFEAYVELAKELGKDDVTGARDLLRSCLKINPGYKPAVLALADTYRISDPAIARKYDELAKTLK